MNGKAAAEEPKSTQKSSCHNPGWNDPPKWAFSPGQCTDRIPTKRLLNKRVAFPLSLGSPVSKSSSVQSSDGISLSQNLQPPPFQAISLISAPHAPLLAPEVHSMHNMHAIDKELALSETMENFEAVISKVLDSSDRKEEVKRRLNTMKIMWKEDKLKDAVYKKVLLISKALRINDVDGADNIHVSLMRDDAALCNTWISGIRHIILELRVK